jgi:hypothetical protein
VITFAEANSHGDMSHGQRARSSGLKSGHIKSLADS